MTAPWAGLCEHCLHLRRIVSNRGSRFVLCAAAATDFRLPRYPQLPVLTCPGFAPGEPAPASADSQEGGAGTPDDL